MHLITNDGMVINERKALEITERLGRLVSAWSGIRQIVLTKSEYDKLVSEQTVPVSEWAHVKIVVEPW